MVCRGTHDDLQRQNLTLHEGMEVLLYMPDHDGEDQFGAFEVKATLYQHPKDTFFIGEYVLDDLKFVPAGPSSEIA